MISLRLYERNGGALLGLLAEPISYDASLEFSDVGALRFEYPANGVNADQIAELREVAVIDSDGNEITNGRFVITSISRDRSNIKGSIAVTAKSLLWRLDTALAYPDGGVNSGEISRFFEDVTAGSVMKTLIDDAKTRGALAGITYSFTATNDSNAVAWPDTLTQEYEARSTLLQVLRSLSDFGLVEAATSARRIDLTIPDGTGADKTLGASPVVLRNGYNLTEAPEEVSADRMAGVALVEGDGGVILERTNATAVSTYGRLETSFTASGIDDPLVLEPLADSYLGTISSAARQLTVGLSLQDGAPQPFIDFTVGDYVYTATSAGLEKVRVRQITLSMSGGSISATATLGDRIFENEIRANRKLAALTSGSVTLGSGTLLGQDATQQIVANNTAFGATAPTNPLDGALWIKSTEGNRLYRFNAATGQWVAVQDTAISVAQATADGKNRIFREPSTPIGVFVAGDLWFDTANDNRIFRYDGSNWVLNTLGNNAIASISASKLTAGTIDASVINVSNINAGNISSGTINSARIAAGSISTDKLVAGTLTGFTINNGNGTFSVNSSGVVSATSGSIGGFTLGSQQIGDGNGTYMSTNGNMACNLLTVRAGAGSTGIILPNGGNISLSSSSILGLGGGTISMSGGTINLGTGTINASSGTINAGAFNVGGTATFSSGANFNSAATFNSTMFAPNLSASTSAVNLRVATGVVGEIQETSASSERYKEDIVDLGAVEEIDPKKLLDLPVRAFRYRPEYLDERDDRSGVLIPGFIAEEVDQIYPIAVDYAEGQPHNWNERFVTPGLLALIQDLYKRIEELESRA